MAKEISGVSSTGTLYARVRKRVGTWWNGSTFETYAAGSYATYALTMTEEGNSGFYTADFPTGITAGGTYEYVVHRQIGGSPAEGDTIINTGKIDWTGTAAVGAVSGSMVGSDWRAYLLRLGFKRTDKDDELYEATTDAIQEMRRRFGFSEAQSETDTTDTIGTLGERAIDLESDFGLLIGVIKEDGNDARPLNHISKSEYDRRYPATQDTSNRGVPADFCVFGEQILIGPIPDSVDYVYRLSYSKRAGVVTSSTSVPFTNCYRDVLADNVLARLYKGLGEKDEARDYKADFEMGMIHAVRRERLNQGLGTFVAEPTDC